MFYVQNISIYMNFGGYRGGSIYCTVLFSFIIQKNRKSARAWPILKSNSTSFWLKIYEKVNENDENGLWNVLSNVFIKCLHPIDFIKWFYQMFPSNGFIKWFHQMVSSKWFHQNGFIKCFYQMVSSIGFINWFVSTNGFINCFIKLFYQIVYQIVSSNVLIKSFIKWLHQCFTKIFHQCVSFKFIYVNNKHVYMSIGCLCAWEFCSTLLMTWRMTNLIGNKFFKLYVKRIVASIIMFFFGNFNCYWFW